VYFSFRTRWWVLDGGTHVFGQVRPYQDDDVQELLSAGVVQGDLNRNGVYGARVGQPVALLVPGAPERSYLIARLRGTMEGEQVPGSRMPLANQPLSVAEMLALFCFVEGMDPSGQKPNLASAIDYAGCSYSLNPDSLNLLGSGVTWQHRIRRILEFNCGGCHSGTDPQAGLVLKQSGAGGQVYARLRMASNQVPGLNLVEPGLPARSYLWLKLTGDPSIAGAPMPLNPLTGQGMLSQAELDDIRVWIEAGAVENQ
ncbi:MAG: hypothetical protein MJD61_09440, partial [Proteobacteria bacterium]|nr:hypothetical protein [Pseudomonadota bacterium]